MDVPICLNPHLFPLSTERKASRHRQPPSFYFTLHEGGLDQRTLRLEQNAAVSSIMERHTLAQAEFYIIGACILD